MNKYMLMLVVALGSMVLGCRDETAASGVAQGPRGEQGPAGQDGAPGQQGPQGPQGPAGIDGKDGAPGADGAPGQPGAAGKDGAPGKDGTNGTNGVNGTNGKDGAPGPKGDPGTSGIQKSALYTIPMGTSVNTQGTYVVKATCLDNDDVLLQGGCEMGGNAAGSVRTSMPTHADDPTAKAEWSCSFSVSTNVQVFLNAYAVCLQVAP